MLKYAYCGVRQISMRMIEGKLAANFLIAIVLATAVTFSLQIGLRPRRSD
jgi:hypothetical protein